MRKQFLEHSTGIIRGIKDISVNSSNATASIASIIFGVTGAFVLYASVAARAGLSVTQTVSWIMAGNIFSCLATIFISLRYKQPIVILPSLSALLITGAMFSQFDMNEIVAGYIMTAIIIIFIGVFNIIGKIEQILPVPIVLAMIAGTFISYGIGLINSTIEQPIVGGIIIGGFLFAHLLPKKIPPLLIAVVAGVICCIFLLPFDVDMDTVGFVIPVLMTPLFSPNVFVSMTIPLVLVVLSGFWRANGILRANGYEPPLNTIVRASGIASLIGAFFMGHTANMAGPMTAIVGVEDAGEKGTRYTASVFGAAGLLLTGIFAGFIIPFVLALPSVVSDIFAGLALIGLFTSTLKTAFGSKRYLKGAFAAFIVGMSGFSALGVDAPVWALVFGIIVSLLTERKDFR